MTLSTESAVTVLIHDQDELVRVGLRALLGSDSRFTVVGDTETVSVALAGRLRPRVILLDPYAHGEWNDHLIADMLGAVPDCRLCIYTTVFESQRFLDAMRTGARGYVLKGDATAAFLLDALWIVGRHGAAVIDPAIVRRFQPPGAEEIMLLSPPTDSPALSEREIIILRGLAQGHSRRQIAVSEHLSLRTVSRAIASLFDRFGVSSSVELIANASARHLLR